MEGATFSERLDLAIGDENSHAFARRAGIPDSTLRRYLSGSMPTVDKLLVLADAAGVTLDWLAAARGPMRPEIVQSRAMALEGLAAGAILLPRFEVRASAGAGALVPAEDVAEHFAVGRDWLRRNLPPWAPLNAEVGVLDGSGDSMEPTIRDGDTLMIVRGVEWRIVERGGIFVFSLDDRLLLKRLQVMASGDLRIISDNPHYEAFTVPAREISDRVTMHGQVFFVGGRPRSV